MNEEEKGEVRKRYEKGKDDERKRREKDRLPALIAGLILFAFGGYILSQPEGLIGGLFFILIGVYCLYVSSK